MGKQTGKEGIVRMLEVFAKVYYFCKHLLQYFCNLKIIFYIIKNSKNTAYTFKVALSKLSEF